MSRIGVLSALWLARSAIIYAAFEIDFAEYHSGCNCYDRSKCRCAGVLHAASGAYEREWDMVALGHAVTIDRHGRRIVLLGDDG